MYNPTICHQEGGKPMNKTCGQCVFFMKPFDICVYWRYPTNEERVIGIRYPTGKHGTDKHTKACGMFKKIKNIQEDYRRKTLC